MNKLECMDSIINYISIELAFKDSEGTDRIHQSRRILYKNPCTGRDFEFITNNFDQDSYVG